MKTLAISTIALALCIALTQGSETDKLSTRSSSCLRLMIVSNNCNNHGYCSQGNNGWACRCDDGWGGRDCVKEMKPAGKRQLAGEQEGAVEGGQQLRKKKLENLLKRLLKE